MVKFGAQEISKAINSSSIVKNTDLERDKKNLKYVKGTRYSKFR